MIYIIVKCRCGHYFIKRLVYRRNKRDKTHITVTCPYCGRHIRVDVTKYKKFPNIESARKYLYLIQRETFNL